MSEAVEVWLPVIGYVGFYDASNLGRVRSVLSRKILKPGTNRGYNHIVLYRDNDGGKTHYIHVVTLSAFCGLAPFVGAEVCHNDGDRSNNCLINLRWGSRQDNVDDRIRHGRQRYGAGCRTTKLNEELVKRMRDDYRAGKSTYALARELGISTNTAWSAVTGATWRQVERPVQNQKLGMI